MSTGRQVRSKQSSVATPRSNRSISHTTARGKSTSAVVCKTTAVLVLIGCLCPAIPVRAGDPHPVRDATIKPETKARLTLQSQINSRLSEAGDILTATLRCRTSFSLSMGAYELLKEQAMSDKL